MPSPYFSRRRPRRQWTKDASDMPSREVADIFLPFVRHPPPKSSIPAKRPSPSSCNGADSGSSSTDNQPKRAEPRTPTTARGVKKDILSPYKSPFAPSPATPVTIAIRTPKPNGSNQPDKHFTPQRSPSSKKPLFERAKKSEEERQKPLSFANVTASCQSVIQDGKIITIKSSDDEDSGSLCSLDEILGQSGSNPTTRSSSSSEQAWKDLEAERLSALSRFTNARPGALIGRDKLRELTSKANGLNFDIKGLVGEHYDDEETQARVDKTKLKYRDSDNQDQLRRQGLMDRSLLASVASGNDGGTDVQRLFNAVERTEALATETTWSMFDPDLSSPDATPSQSAFASSEDFYSETGGSESTIPTEAVYLSDSLTERALTGALPDEILALTFSRLFSETREDLRQSYIRLVKAASPRWVSTALTETRVARLFCQLGANASKVRCATILKPQPQKAAPGYLVEIEGMLSTIDLLAGLSAKLAPQALSKFVQLLMRVAIDCNLMSNSRTSIAVENTISSLLNNDEKRVSEMTASCILEDIGTRVQDPFLQTQCLKHILPTSQLAASLRIRLANRFLLRAKGNNPIYTVDPSTPAEVNVAQLTAHLDHDPRFDISHCKRDDSSIDYNTLSSLVYIFDAAVADGGRPSTFPNNATASSESEFNHSIDRLADRVKSIHTSIADAGASHMRRTEAKEALNALHFRLLYGARTKPRPRRSVFGGGSDRCRLNGGRCVEEDRRSASLMQDFLLRSKEQKQLKDRKQSAAGPVGLELEREGNGRRDSEETLSTSRTSESEILIRRQLGLEDLG